MTRSCVMFVCLWLVVGGACGPAAAQVLMHPTEAPSESAALAAWFVADEPLVVNGVVFHRAGAEVFFDGQSMVRVGWYRGTPVYADTTVEPNSLVLVPVGGRMMQPYERRRDLDAAGTTGSRAPSFPVRLAVAGSGHRQAGDLGPAWGLDTGAMAAAPPVSWERAGYASLLGREPDADRWATPAAMPRPVGTAGGPAREAPWTPGPPPGGLTSVPGAVETLGVWIEHAGERWQACGPAVPAGRAGLQRTGTYRGHAVLADPGDGGQRIWLPTRAGFVAPFWRGPVSHGPSGQCLPGLREGRS